METTKTDSAAADGRREMNGDPGNVQQDGIEPPRRSRRLVLPAVIVALVAGAIAAYVLVLERGSGDEAAATAETTTTTATAARRDVVETESLDGTLTYAGETTVIGQAEGGSAAAGGGGGQSATITRLAAEGLTRKPGQALYWVNGEPVVLMKGQIPAWRTLADGVDDGWDVRQLEDNLVALGYDPDEAITVDREFTGATADAVERWQEDLGLEQTGAIELGRVVFLPGPQRVGAHLTTAGASATPGGQVMKVSSTDQVVSLRLDADRQDLVSEGQRVTVELPDGTSVKGAVAEIGTVAKVDAASSATDGAGEPYVEVTITLTAAAGIQLDQAPVDVLITTESKQNVLTVPVTALVALQGGGYAVEVVEGETTALVAVEPGLFADGFVEVESAKLAEGDSVVVPQ